jgi:hypothetical protein
VFVIGRLDKAVCFQNKSFLICFNKRYSLF